MKTNRNNTFIKTRNIRNMILGLDVPILLDNGRRVPAINLDNAATTPAFKAVADAIHKELLYYGSIGRGMGQKSEHSSEVYSRGRSAVKDFLGANSDKYTVLYTNNTTDGMNKLASALIENPNDLVLTTKMEHHANTLPWQERGKVVYAEVDDKGRLNINHLQQVLLNFKGKVKYVSVTAASNVTGYVNDVHFIAKIAHHYGAKIIVDGAQIVSHRRFSMLGETPAEDIDFFVFSAHKMYSPYGGGAVIGLTHVLNEHLPEFYGGGMVEAVYQNHVCYSMAPDRYEAGSPNYPGVVGMLKSMEILENIGFQYIEEHEQRLLKKTLDILKEIPGVILYGDNEHITDRVGILVFNLNGFEPEDVANTLANERGIALRHAAFCAHPYVRHLTGESEDNTHNLCTPPRGMIRISFGIYNTEEDVEAFIKTIIKILSSPHSASISSVNEIKNSSKHKSTLPNDRG